MPSLFRSENVELCQIIIPNESAYSVFCAIGELGHMQFVDKNQEIPAFNRKFTQNIMWCEEMERKLRFFEESLKNEKLVPEESVEEQNIPAPHINEFGELEAEMDSMMKQVNQSNDNLTSLLKGFNELVEYRYVLRSSDDAVGRDSNDPLSSPDQNITEVHGIIRRDKFLQFEQLLWRSCHGNILLRQIPIDEEIKSTVSGDKVAKCVFIVFLQGDKLVSKVRLVCDSFQASIYSVPHSKEEKISISNDLQSRMQDMEMVINQTNDQRRIIFSQILKLFGSWRAKILKIKAIFTALNMLVYDTGSRALVGECWCPSVHIDNIRGTIQQIQLSENTNLPVILNVIKSKASPPTYYQTNRFTDGFQNLVDAYGMAAYKEVNPSLYMIITFPFLFAIMFGDFGHGLCILSAGLVLVIREKQLIKLQNNELFGMIYSGRYVVVLMGFFSLYTGFIYNDIISKSVYLWNSSWDMPTNTSHGLTIAEVMNTAQISPSTAISLDPRFFSQPNPYPIGVDPIWMFATNKITFSNSFKMKTSIIIGFCQMFFGIILSLVNHLYFGHHLEIYTEFIPQVIFFLAIFGYLNFMIFYKWIFFSSQSPATPSILLALIGMFVNFGKPIADADRLYSSQQFVEPALVVIAFICIPWMFIVKPVVLMVKMVRERKRTVNPDRSENNSLPHTPVHTEATEGDNLMAKTDSDSGTTDPHHGQNKSAAEIWIMQLIHTIEFVLGSISNTASYLRLWALSLAHSQLSELLWSMLLRLALTSSSPAGCIMITIIFMVFIFFTLMILVVMEGLSAFLHAIRLHWVEFQSKFYIGTGTIFLPFSLKKAVQRNNT